MVSGSSVTSPLGPYTGRDTACRPPRDRWAPCHVRGDMAEVDRWPGVGIGRPQATPPPPPYIYLYMVYTPYRPLYTEGRWPSMIDAGTGRQGQFSWCMGPDQGEVSRQSRGRDPLPLGWPAGEETLVCPMLCPGISGPGIHPLTYMAEQIASITRSPSIIFSFITGVMLCGTRFWRFFLRRYVFISVLQKTGSVQHFACRVKR